MPHTPPEMPLLSGPVLVGVVPRQQPAVLLTAAALAERLGVELVCASVDASRYAVDERPDGTVVATSLDPDLADELVEAFDPSLLASIAATLEGRAVRWSTRMLAGGAGRELGRLAAAIEASVIVVGTRERGLRASMRELVNGSVAVQLAHRQHRPVVIVPLAPVDEDVPLWVGEG